MTENYIIPTLESVTAVPEKALATSALLNQRFDKVNELLALIREALKFATADDVANGTQSVYPDAAQVLAGIQAHGFKASELTTVWSGSSQEVELGLLPDGHPGDGLYFIQYAELGGSLNFVRNGVLSRVCFEVDHKDGRRIEFYVSIINNQGLVRGYRYKYHPDTDISTIPKEQDRLYQDPLTIESIAKVT